MPSQDNSPSGSIRPGNSEAPVRSGEGVGSLMQELNKRIKQQQQSHRSLGDDDSRPHQQADS